MCMSMQECDYVCTYECVSECVYVTVCTHSTYALVFPEVSVTANQVNKNLAMLKWLTSLEYL